MNTREDECLNLKLKRAIQIKKIELSILDTISFIIK